jgi:hypothetical protein
VGLWITLGGGIEMSPWGEMIGTEKAAKETVIAIKELTETINRNNEVTAEQNKKMVKYNRWLVGLTIGIGIIAVVQVIAMFIK